MGSISANVLHPHPIGGKTRNNVTPFLPETVQGSLQRIAVFHHLVNFLRKYRVIQQVAINFLLLATDPLVSLERLRR